MIHNSELYAKNFKKLLVPEVTRSQVDGSENISIGHMPVEVDPGECLEKLNNVA